MFDFEAVDAEIAAAKYPKIRLFQVKKTTAEYPMEDVEAKSWAACTPETVADSSAAAYFFAREIQQRTLGQSLIEILCEQPMPAIELESFLKDEKYSFSEDRKSLTVHSTKPARTIVELVKWIDQQGIELADIHLKRPTLEDVFIELTGKRLRE